MGTPCALSYPGRTQWLSPLSPERYPDGCFWCSGQLRQSVLPPPQPLDVSKSFALGIETTTKHEKGEPPALGSNISLPPVRTVGRQKPVAFCRIFNNYAMKWHHTFEHFLLAKKYTQITLVFLCSHMEIFKVSSFFFFLICTSACEGRQVLPCSDHGKGREHPCHDGEEAQSSWARLGNTLRKTSHANLDIQYFTIKRVLFLFNVTFKNLNTQKMQGECSQC